MTDAVLFARTDSVYRSLPDVEVYDIERDARTFAGGMPVVAHPPCRAALWPRPGAVSWCGDGEHDVRLRIIRIVLTIAHLDHQPENCADDNLRAWCQRCHVTYDAQHHAATARRTRRQRLAVAEHQRLTIERYDALLACQTGVYIMPVLQGYAPEDYVTHVRAYGPRLGLGAWVGVGSVCKRNGDPAAIFRVLRAIHDERPDLRLHGFGLKTTALSSPAIVDMLHSADSMAWSFAARKQGRNANDWREAAAFAGRIGTPADDPQIGLALA